MNKDAAKQILSLYRSPQLDGTDPEVQEALQIAQNDPELRHWLTANQQFHRSAREALRSVEPPVHLKEQILARRKVVPLWTRREFIIAAAASVAALATGGTFWWRGYARQQALAKFENRMMDYAVRAYGMDILTDDASAVRSYLASKAAPADFSLPPKLAVTPVMGGARLSFEGRPVSMMCFKLKEKTAYLFVMDADPAQTALSGLRFGSYDRLTNAIWAMGGRIYLLGAEIPEADVRELVGGTG